MKKKLIASIVLALANPIASDSTCIIIIFSNNTFTIGADSEVTNPGYYLTSKGRRDTVFLSSTCKIRKQGNIYYAGAGWQMDAVMDFAKEALLKQDLRQDSISYPILKAREKLEKSIEQIRIHDRKKYIHDYDGVFARVIFLWFDNAIAKDYLITFHCINKPLEKTKVELVPEIMKLVDGSIMPLGDVEKISNLFTSPVFWKGKNNFQGISELIKTQIDHSDMNKITIMNISFHGAEMLQNGACEIKNYQ